TVQRWANDFLTQLQNETQQRRDRLHNITPLEINEMVQDFARANSRAIFLDYDGTLTAFVNTPNPARARPSRSLLALLRTIAAMPNTRLHIISGRTRYALETWFGGLPATLVAEH